MKDIFISHAWGNDSLNRDNHKRCKILADTLIKNGYTVWFDSYDLFGNIDSTIMKGINNCKVVIICLTKKYCDKINNAVINQLPNDNCYKEWNYSLFKQKIIVPIIMEPCMQEIYTKTDGIIQLYLHTILYIDFSNNFEDEMDMLRKNLKSHHVYNINEKSFYKNTLSSSYTNFLHSYSGLTIPTLSPNTIRKFKYLNNNKNDIYILSTHTSNASNASNSNNIFYRTNNNNNNNNNNDNSRNSNESNKSSRNSNGSNRSNRSNRGNNKIVETMFTL